MNYFRRFSSAISVLIVVGVVSGCSSDESPSASSQAGASPAIGPAGAQSPECPSTGILDLPSGNDQELARVTLAPEDPVSAKVCRVHDGVVDEGVLDATAARNLAKAFNALGGSGSGARRSAGEACVADLKPETGYRTIFVLPDGSEFVVVSAGQCDSFDYTNTVIDVTGDASGNQKVLELLDGAQGVSR